VSSIIVRPGTKNRTSDQIISADPSSSVWVGANAGTGKTGVLVDRILRLLLAGVSPNRILCLTFTKAAAAEMESRLIEQLGKWVGMSEVDLSISLKELTGTKIDKFLLRQAPLLFSKILDAPGGLKIRTIHSFCESLLGRFPIEAGISPHFKVIDERTQAELKIESRRRLMESASNSCLPIQNSLNYLATLIDEKGLANIINSLDKHQRRLDQMFQLYGSIDSIMKGLCKRLNIAKTETKDSILDHLTNLDGQDFLIVIKVLSRGSASDQSRGLLINKWLSQPRKYYKEYNSIFLKKNGKPKAESRLLTKKLRESNSEAIKILLAEQERLVIQVEKLKALKIIKATRALLIVTFALKENYQALKLRRSLLDYDDLILRAGELLKDGGANWVHYKLDGGIDHILVDEAQDTSPEQWQVIIDLAQDFFSGEGSGDEVRILPRTIFAVGDKKQSIDSFQGADPADFFEMRELFSNRGKEGGGAWKEVDLSVSFRAVPILLKVVDQIFKPYDVRDGLIEQKDVFSHKSSRDGQAGLVELWPTFKPDDLPKNDPWDAPLDQLSQTSPMVKLTKAIASKIKAWLEVGEFLKSGVRKIEPGDIMILVRTRGQFVEEMVRQLKESNVPVAGSDRMILLEQLVIMDLIAIGQFALLPEDDLNLAIVLKSPFIGLNDDDLFVLSNQRTSSLWDSLKEQVKKSNKFKKATEFLKIILETSHQSPPYEFYLFILNQFEGRRNLLKRLGPDAADPIDEFLNLCLTYEEDHTISLIGFLSWLKSSETQIKRDLDRGQNQVRVMTVHGAKGLQANIVFLPDTCNTPTIRPDSRFYWDNSLFIWPILKDNEEAVCNKLSEKQKLEVLKEYRRLLYVAITRAEESVYVCGWETINGRKDGCWYDHIENALTQMSEVKTIKVISGQYGLRVEDVQVAKPDRPHMDKDPEKFFGELPNWALRVPKKVNFSLSYFSPSSQDEKKSKGLSPLSISTNNSRERGLLIHKLLEILPNHEALEQKSVGAHFLSRFSNIFNEKEQFSILNEVIGVLTSPDLENLFGMNSIAEIPLMGLIGKGTGTGLISGQIDRLFISKKKITVIDFKTDKFPPLASESIPKDYIKQMAAYEAALIKIFPEKEIELLILWTRGPFVTRVENQGLEFFGS